MRSRSALMSALLALAAPQLDAADAPGDDEPFELAQLMVRERIIVRVPRMRVSTLSATPPRPIRWKEKRGPRCVAAGALAGALVTAPDAIDLVLRGGSRVRARLEDECRTLDFYSGFYVRPGRDGMVCADRDAIRGRSGTVCPIDRFRTLVAQD